MFAKSKGRILKAVLVLTAEPWCRSAASSSWQDLQAAVPSRRDAQHGTTGSMCSITYRIPDVVPEGQESLDMGTSCSVKGLESTGRHNGPQDRQSCAPAASDRHRVTASRQEETETNL